jgi:hypothetical protein
MIVSHEHCFIFVKTRKTAGSSIELALAPFLGPHDIATAHSPEDADVAVSYGARPQNTRIPLRRWGVHEIKRRRYGPVRFYDHMPAAMIRRLLPREWKEYVTFTVVRDPCEVAVSAYFWARQRWSLDMSLAEFVRSDHLRRYANWQTYTAADEVIVDVTLRHERLAEEWPALTDRLGLPRVTLPRAKGGFRTDGRPARQLLSEEDRQIVERVAAPEPGWLCPSLCRPAEWPEPRT